MWYDVQVEPYQEYLLMQPRSQDNLIRLVNNKSWTDKKSVNLAGPMTFVNTDT